MNKPAIIATALVLSSFVSGQRAASQHKAQPPAHEALTADFKDAALEAFDAVDHISSRPGVSETEAALTKTEATKALDKAHRKVKSPLDRNVYDLLAAYHLFKDMSVLDTEMVFDDRTSLATKQKYGEYQTFDLKGEDQCYWEVRVVLEDDLERVTKEALEQGRSHLCFAYSEELSNRITAQSKELK